MSVAALPERPVELRAVLTGNLTYATASGWRDVLIGLAARRPRRLTVDLRDVAFVDVSAFATIRALERRLAPSEGKIVLHASPHLLGVLRCMGIDHLVSEP